MNEEQLRWSHAQLCLKKNKETSVPGVEEVSKSVKDEFGKGTRGQVI